MVEDGKAHVSYSVVCKDFCKLSVTDMNATGLHYFDEFYLLLFFSFLCVH